MKKGRDSAEEEEESPSAFDIAFAIKDSQGICKDITEHIIDQYELVMTKKRLDTIRLPYSSIHSL